MREPGCANSLKSVNMAGDEIKKLDMFCYLKDDLCTEDEVQLAVTVRRRVG